MRIKRLVALFLSAVTLSLPGCDAEPASTTDLAEITRYTVDATNHTITLEGVFANSCDALGDITENVDGGSATITVFVSRRTGDDCVDQPAPFTATIPLAMDLSQGGRYTFLVNGVPAVLAVNAAGLATGGVGEQAPLAADRVTAPVESVDIVLLESFPVQARLQVRGTLPSGCFNLAGSEQTRRGELFDVTLYAREAIGDACSQEAQPYDESISLDVLGLPAGIYSVTVNGVSAQFSLEVDNSFQGDPLDACGFEDPSQPAFANLADGYCVQYPLGFEASIPGAGTLLIFDTTTSGARAALTIERRPSDGLPPAALADIDVADVVAAPGTLAFNATTIGGAPAVIVDNLPGAARYRRVYLVRDDVAIVFTLSPLDEARPDASARAVELWAMVAESFVFLAPGADE